MAIHSLPSPGEEVGDDIVAEINITPLVDIFLVLLIIFMVTTSVITSQGKQVDLPGAAVAKATPSGVTVTIDSEGAIQIGDKAVRPEALTKELKAALDASREKVVILRGDRKVLLGQAVNILDVAQQAGASGIALATRPPAAGEK
ncbi:Biopolymer transport protein ExbD [Myxococcaceae bacterium]|nr:Biopolymer transport protein ExbD [Myxococcaceae bacterium]